MGKIVKKFFEYVKEDLTPNRELGKTSLEFEDEGDSGAGTWGAGEGAQDEDEMNYPAKPIKASVNDEFSDEEDFEEEEPGYEGGRMLMELAKKLGKKVINNEIDYNGSTITCYSEDNKFRLDDQIIGSNVDQALKNIGSKPSASEGDFVDEEEEILERRSHRHTCKCGKCK